MMQHCEQHSETKYRLDKNDTEHTSIWKAIDQMRNWVIAGMGSMLAYFLVIAGNFIFDKIAGK